MDQFKHFLGLNISEFDKEFVFDIKKVTLLARRSCKVIAKLSKVAFFSPFFAHFSAPISLKLDFLALNKKHK